MFIFIILGVAFIAIGGEIDFNALHMHSGSAGGYFGAGLSLVVQGVLILYFTTLAKRKNR